MDQEQFCYEYCPMPCRSTDRTGGSEVECDGEYEECPFNDVDFSKVKQWRDPVFEIVDQEAVN